MHYSFSPNRRASKPAHAGFTFIEVLIVLAIAGLILLIVLFAIPALQRNSRNYSRKRFVDAIGAQLHQYYADNHKYPTTTAEGSAFISGYLSDIKGYYTVNFWDLGHAHDYMPPLDTVAVQYGHWCNKYGDGDAASDAIAGTDLDPNMFVIWTKLEPNSTPPATFCVDNHR